jgi:hypothetical protein
MHMDQRQMNEIKFLIKNTVIQMIRDRDIILEADVDKTNYEGTNLHLRIKIEKEDVYGFEILQETKTKLNDESWGK